MTDEEWKQFIRSLWRLTDDRTMEDLKDIERRYNLREVTDEQFEQECAKIVERGMQRQFTRRFTDRFINLLQKEEKL